MADDLKTDDKIEIMIDGGALMPGGFVYHYSEKSDSGSVCILIVVASEIVERRMIDFMATLQGKCIRQIESDLVVNYVRQLQIELGQCCSVSNQVIRAFVHRLCSVSVLEHRVHLECRGVQLQGR